MNKTTLIVREAMRIVSKDVRPPKCVRDGLVKPVEDVSFYCKNEFCENSTGICKTQCNQCK